MEKTFRQAALEYHEQGRPGKISVTPTKTLSNQRDLALAYSPGVAAAKKLWRIQRTRFGTRRAAILLA